MKEKIISYGIKSYKSNIFDVVNLVYDSLKETLNIEKLIDNIFEKLGFNDYFKGTKYLKDAIILTYYDKTLLLDAKLLVKMLQEKIILLILILFVVIWIEL